MTGIEPRDKFGKYKDTTCRAETNVTTTDEGRKFRQ
jgi:hypothetical protein